MAESEKKPLMLIVDDTPENIDVLRGILGSEFRIKVAVSGEKALKIVAGSEKPDLILLDVMMPGMDGYEVCRRLKSEEMTRKIPVIFVTAKDQVFDETYGFSVGAVDYLTKPVVPEIVLARVRAHVELKLAREEIEKSNQMLEIKVRERTAELSLTQEVTIQSLAALAETRDNDTGDHIIRTQRYVKILAEYCAKRPEFTSYLTSETIELLYKSAALHDIGKVGIPDRVLLKPGKLTPEEFEEMKKHTNLGAEAIEKAEKLFGPNRSSSFLRFAREIAHTHQEKWDGTGYPRGLKENDIPISGRLMAIADVYDALVSRRCYKAPFSHEVAVKIISEASGKHFDPGMIEVFKEIHLEFKKIADELSYDTKGEA
ncbi:MAG: two-component system response regulator [Candidatus Riflebacteria bacterium]|nr:two-component system response regulator [Candidatus Riflebacteria bacterium]